MDATKRSRQTSEASGAGKASFPGRAFLGAAVVFIAAAVFVPGFVKTLNALSIRTVPAAMDTLRDERSLHGLVVRREVVVKAPRDGLFAPLVREDERVRTGQPVGLITSGEEQTAVLAPAPGIVRFHWDGWEGLLVEDGVWQRSPIEWREWRETSDDPETFDDFRPPTDGPVSRGAPLLRLVDSHGVRLYVDMPAGGAWRRGQTVFLTVPEISSEPLRATVVETGRAGETQQGAALLELQRYLPVLDAVRHLDVHVVLSSHEGVVLPVESLVWSEGEAGVLVRRQGKIRFAPVVVLAQVGDDVALQGIAPGERIVVNPWRVAGW